MRRREPLTLSLSLCSKKDPEVRRREPLTLSLSLCSKKEPLTLSLSLCSKKDPEVRRREPLTLSLSLCSKKDPEVRRRESLTLSLSLCSKKDPEVRRREPLTMFLSLCSKKDPEVRRREPLTMFLSLCSKKDPEVRRRELLEAVSEPMLKTASIHCLEWMTNSSLCVLLTQILSRCSGECWLEGRMLDFRSRGPGFESLGHRSVGVSRLTIALALEVGNPPTSAPHIYHKNYKPGQFNQIYFIGLHVHKTHTKKNICDRRSLFDLLKGTAYVGGSG